MRFLRLALALLAGHSAALSQLFAAPVAAIFSTRFSCVVFCARWQPRYARRYVDVARSAIWRAARACRRVYKMLQHSAAIFDDCQDGAAP